MKFSCVAILPFLVEGKDLFPSPRKLHDSQGTSLVFGDSNQVLASDVGVLREKRRRRNRSLHQRTPGAGGGRSGDRNEAIHPLVRGELRNAAAADQEQTSAITSRNHHQEQGAADVGILATRGLDAGSGDCCSLNGSPGCDDLDGGNVCEEAVCAYDSFCCDILWDEFCVAYAQGAFASDCDCNGGGPGGDAGSGECCASGNDAGCDNPDGGNVCEEAVCAMYPDCCTDYWSYSCAAYALETSPDVCPCGDLGSGDCFSYNGTPGCDDPVCARTVCGLDQFCCLTYWDEICAAEAQTVCEAAPPSGSCCIANGSSGCDDDPEQGTGSTCEETVCADMPACCDSEWDEVCAKLAYDKCDDICSVDARCPCDSDWTNHGRYVQCVSHVTNELKKLGLIKGKEKGAFMKAAGKSNCGK